MVVTRRNQGIEWVSFVLPL
ncbi:uncharacterized protein M6B38_337540 [Iris pallida]|nr:uncharacterized protein M6B38_337540 [Iris pallida]